MTGLVVLAGILVYLGLATSLILRGFRRDRERYFQHRGKP